jgi:hypothetical protein
MQRRGALVGGGEQHGGARAVGEMRHRGSLNRAGRTWPRCAEVGCASSSSMANQRL